MFTEAPKRKREKDDDENAEGLDVNDKNDDDNKEDWIVLQVMSDPQSDSETEEKKKPIKKKKESWTKKLKKTIKDLDGSDDEGDDDLSEISLNDFV